MPPPALFYLSFSPVRKVGLPGGLSQSPLCATLKSQPADRDFSPNQWDGTWETVIPVVANPGMRTRPKAPGPLSAGER